VTTVAAQRQVRVAIYTRQSVASDLEFGSLQAQREAVAAYITSQRGEGWVELPTHYDDHGFSGGTLERPAFERLVADVSAGKVDLIATYKIDRISRSLPDFTKFITLLEQRGVGFVSTTQSFDTRTSMGRLTLNILASFSQFEREVISERIKDKMQATRRRGAWTGGRPILGYDVVAKRLVVNTDEAQQVSSTFQLYLEHGTLRATVAELRRRGWRNKSFTTKKGTTATGNEFTTTTLHSLLTNVLYIGRVRAGEDLVQGAHEAVVAHDLWDTVQQQLRANANDHGVKTRNATGALLRGLLRCKRCGSTMTHTFSTKKDRRYRFYTCARLHTEGAEACPGSRVAAGPFETFVCNQIKVIGTDEQLLAKTAEALERRANEHREPLEAELRRGEREMQRLQGDDERARVLAARLDDASAELAAFDHAAEPRLRAALANFTAVWEQLFPAERERALRLLIERIDYCPDTGTAGFELRPAGIETLAKEATR
jgi:site-specific DNA recombinase